MKTMKTIAFFNNKGGVGKTTLVYHLAHMFAHLDIPTVCFDLDPQANLTSAFLREGELEELWAPTDGGDTVLGSITPILQGLGDIAPPKTREIDRNLWLLPGHLGLSRFEDKLSQEWPKVNDGDPAAARVETAFYRTMKQAGDSLGAELGLIDVGPNLGAINRAALISADYLVIPLAADLFSLQGLRNLGPTVRMWRNQWQVRLVAVRDMGIPVPSAKMTPLGYVVLQHEVRLDRPVKAFQRWFARIPTAYARAVIAGEEVNLDELASEEHVGDDRHCLANLRNYRSLMPLAQDARKPMFMLKAADGAIGGHARLVQHCFEDFLALATKIWNKVQADGEGTTS